jgi:hypothetical protein
MPRVLGVTLPDWSSPHHPVTRMVLRHASPSTTMRWARWIGYGLSGLFVAGTLLSSVVAYRDGSLDDLFLPGEASWFVIPYFFLLLVQAGTLIGAPRQVFGLGLTLPSAPVEMQRESWELVKVTSAGASLVTRARWVVLLYRMRGLLVVILVARLWFGLAVVFRALMAPDALRAALAQGAPGLSSELGMGLVVIFVAGVQLMFPALLLFSTACGVCTSTVIRRERSGLLVVLHQGGALVAMLLFSAAMLAGWSAALFPHQWTVRWDAWDLVSVFAMLVAGDQGLRLLSWDALLRTIAGVDNGIWLGVPLLALALSLIALSVGLLRWSARRAGRPGKE